MERKQRRLNVADVADIIRHLQFILYINFCNTDKGNLYISTGKVYISNNLCQVNLHVLPLPNINSDRTIN